MPKKAESAKNDNRVWIELERPTSPEQGKARAALVSSMLHRLGMAGERVWWSEHEARYCYGDGTGYIVLSDDGHWFSLDYFGRVDTLTEPTEGITQQAADFRTLQEKLVACGWQEVHDEDVTFIAHGALGMQQPSWVDAISACIEVASEA